MGEPDFGSGEKAGRISRVPRPKRTACLFLIVIWMSIGSWGTPIRFEVPQTPLPLLDGAQFLVDHTSALGFEEARARFAAGAVEKVVGDELYLGSMQGAVWLRFTLRNEIRDEHFVLEIQNPRLLEADFYDPNGRTTIHKRAGTANPFFEREYYFPSPAFMLQVPPGTERDVYVRVANTGDMRVSARLWTHRGFDRHAALELYPDLVLAGVFFAFALYHLCIYVVLRRLVYLFIAILVATFGLFFVAMNGTGSMLLWPDWPWYAERSISIPTFLISGFGVVFVVFYLEAWRFAKRASWVAYGIAAFCFVSLLYAALTDGLLRTQLMRVAGILGPFTGLTLVAIAIYCRQRAGWYLLVTWGFAMLMGILTVVAGMGLVSSRLLNGQVFAGVFLAAMLFWSFELTGRIRKQQLEIRRDLESEVKERTTELRSALREVNALSGLLPICSHCKNIRDDKGYWNSVENYIREHTDADFTHGICPECMKAHFPDYSNQRPPAGPVG
ncbi:MAG: hypothetical protein HYV27_13920 [Candidatus Hydrogenedentes bacterium]|nr:hypothetical protein [Candidatus Hydrogenedentota bacterium]